MAPIIPVIFEAGATGAWRVDRIDAVAGPPLAPAAHLNPRQALSDPATDGVAWTLRGVAGHPRYVTKMEQQQLAQTQAGLGRVEATCAALIPIRKSSAWWDLAQDERRTVLEETSHHISGSLRYLPAIARRLYQCRELGEPFDFLTWFEYAPAHAAQFDELVATLRATEEWKYVTREVDIRLRR